ncbi:VanZ like family protein [compost metagenome]
MLAYLFWSVLTLLKGKNVWKVGLVLLLAVVIAALDEWNQSALSSRTGVIQDVGIDFIGACLGLIAGLMIQTLKKRQKRN